MVLLFGCYSCWSKFGSKRDVRFGCLGTYCLPPCDIDSLLLPEQSGLHPDHWTLILNDKFDDVTVSVVPVEENNYIGGIHIRITILRRIHIGVISC